MEKIWWEQWVVHVKSLPTKPIRYYGCLRILNYNWSISVDINLGEAFSGDDSMFYASESMVMIVT